MILAATVLAVVDVLEADPALAARLARVLGAVPPADERIPLAQITAHGAPSARWCAARKIVRGPRGGRYVLAAELEGALATSTIARRAPAAPLASANLEDDARAAVVSLAARRSRRSA